MRIILFILAVLLVTGRTAPAQTPARGSWPAVVEQLMLLENELPALQDVMATRQALVLRFAGSDTASVNRAVAVVARILNGSREDLYLTVTAPAPAVIAAAATAGGFPPERIALTDSFGPLSIQALRLEPAALAPSAPPSRRQ